MKKILITGKSSYIGNQFESWINKWENNYKINKLSVRGDAWESVSFKGYDTILHLAGIAHVSKNPKMESLYYEVNRDLTIRLAKKAKAEGVRQFIFMSSIIVYGDSIKGKQTINKNTLPKPSNFYGNSKLEAEKGIIDLEDEKFKVVIIRPPMIYGKGSKGNYPKLAKLAKVTPVFPNIENQRSMLHINNLCQFIKLLIDNNDRGLFFPQNREYVRTSELVKLIGSQHGKNVKLINSFNPLIQPLIGRINIINKLFGNLVYEKEISNYKQNYQIFNLIETIKKTES